MVKKKQHNTANFYFSSRIIESFNGIFSYPLTIIEAPMGYGKTTAVRNFLNDAQVNVIWNTIYNNSILEFWNNFSKTFYELDGDCSENLLQIGFASDNSAAEEAVDLIGSIKFSEKTVLVIDDYHLINNSLVDEFIEKLGQRRIDNFYIILTARFIKFERLEEFLLKRCLYHVKKEIFELQPKEIMGYFKICGLNLSYDEAEKLYFDTEGWISALYLFMLDYASSGSYTPMESIFKLLEKTVYASLSYEMKDFLITLCSFDCFTLNQAEYMWEKGKADKLLGELIENNLFVTYDKKLKTYSIHNIFSGLLKEKLEEKDINYKQELYKKAGRYLINKKNFFAARLYFYKAGDFDGILLALEEDESNDYSVDNKDLLKKYMQECPLDVKKRHHYGMLEYSMHLFIHRETELFEKTCEELSFNIENDSELDIEKRDRLLGELELLLSFSEFNDLKKMTERHQKAWKLLKKPATIRYLKSKWAFGIPSVLSLYYRESGMIKEHIKDLEEGLSYYYRLTDGHGSGAEYAMEAESCFNQGNFENAEILVQKALLKAQNGVDDNILFSARYFQILIVFMKNDLVKFWDLMNKIHEETTFKKKYYYHVTEICEGCIYAYLDQLNKIPERILNADLGCPPVIFPAYPFFNVLYGRILLIKGEYLKLIGSGEYFIAVASVFNNLLGYIYTYIYLAAAYRKIFREKDAMDNLKKALEIAMPDKQYMLFVENCDYIEPLLNNIYLEGSYKDEIEKIFELYKIFKKSKDQLINEYFLEKKSNLTEREYEIALLAAEGKTNKEIGSELYISSNTVKKALKSVYEKLGINNRVLLKHHLDNQ